MAVKVLKFGGSSVADANQLRKVKAIVEADPERRLVVVSAPGKRSSEDVKITDMLYTCRDLAAQGKPFDDVFEKIEARFFSIREELGVTADLESSFAEIRKALEEGCSADYAASRGEHLSAVLNAGFLGFDFIETKGLVLFDKNGNLLADETDAALRAELKKHDCAVIPGFYGSEAETGDIRVFSRGGSDITGALVARAADASLYENWTDVSGMLMTDPRIVDGPAPIDSISFAELRALSYMGASVLHEDAVFPCRAAGIPINIRNTNRPDDAGTMIGAPDAAAGIVRGIAGKKGFAALTVAKDQMNRFADFAEKTAAVLREAGSPAERIVTGVDTMTLIVSEKTAGPAGEKAASLLRTKLDADRVDAQGGLALLAAVGSGIGRDAAAAAKMAGALSDAGIEVALFAAGADPYAVTAAVPEKAFEDAVRAVYGAFCNGR